MGERTSESPILPEASQWQFPGPSGFPPGEDLVATGADLEPGTLLAAYISGCFPMPVNRKSIGWFSPDPRGILRPENLRVTKSMRQSMKRYEVTINHAFDDVISGCADPSRPMGWIDQRIMKAYSRLHEMGWVHSVEVWDEEGLAGGLYGVSIGGLFAGESMFHRRRDASKVALAHLVEVVGQHPDTLIDIQWLTPHLASLGAEECSRVNYLDIAMTAITEAPPLSWPMSP